MICYQREAYTDEELYALFHPLVREWFSSRFKGFSPPQRFAIPLIHQGKNCLISAPTGSGKCIIPQTPVLILRDGRAEIVEAGDLLKEAGRELLHFENGILYEGRDLEVYALNPQGQVERAEAYIYAEHYEGIIYEIETQGGRRVALSPDHPLLVETDAGYVWKPVREIRVGDRIGAPKRINLPEVEIHFDPTQALQRLQDAEVLVTRRDFDRLESKTASFKNFSRLYPQELRNLLAIVGVTYPRLAEAIGVRSIATIHRLIYGKTDYKRRELERFLQDRLRGAKFEANRVVVQTGNSVHRFTYPRRVDQRLVEWVAFLLAEGHIHSGRDGAFLSVSQKRRPELLVNFLRATEELFQLRFQRKGKIDYVLNSTPFVRFITSLLDLKPGRSRDVPFPSWLLNLPRELKARFLRVFFSLEAEVSLKRISIVQSSRRKIEQLHYLLLSFGIYSSIRERVKWATNTAAKRGRIYYELEISGMENLRRFSEEIGIDHPKAAELFSHISERKPSGAHVHVGRFHFDYRDITSVRPQFEFGRWAGFQREVGGLYEVVRRTGFITSAPSALKAKAKARAKAKVSPLQGGHAEDLLKTIEEIRAQNLTWLEVKSVKPRSYRGLLIDLSVPRLENFIGGGTAIYLHNTLSAFLAILSELVTLAERGELENRIYCAYVSPLKALGNDIRRNLHEPLEGIAELARRDLGIRVAVRTGDTSTQEKQRMLAKTPHILITTPESFAISLTSKEFSKAFHRIRWVIVDEIHALAENKRGAHLSLSLERLSERVEPVRIGLSATIHPLEEVAKFLVGRRYGRELEGLAGEGDRADPYRECVIVDARFAKGLDLGVLSPVEDFISCSAGELYGNLYELLAELVEAHRTTLIFTNTRSRTERVVYQLKERRPRLVELIGAHHGSLSRELRLGLEERLKRGELKAVATSTSLELGIDIGYIDLVILLGSPKSVTRALQRVGRSGHKLHDRVKGRAIVTDQDDLLECAIMLKCALENKLDRIHIPKNCLDVLAQQIFGILMDGPAYVEDLWELVTRSYNFESLDRADFERVLEYLAGEYVSLEDRRVYAKVWYDRRAGRLGKRGRLARVIYMTNVGTIPDESYITVKHGERRIGQIEESFLEYLRKGDIFVLGGETYQFRYSRGMTAQVEPAEGKSPTVPSWFSEMLPLSFDLALEIQEFRYKLSRMFEEGHPPEKIKGFIRDYLHLGLDFDLEGHTVESIYNYFARQHLYSVIPHRYKILIERYREDEERTAGTDPAPVKIKSWAIFHALFGRRVNEALARAVAWVIARREDRDVEIMVTDHGFALGYEGEVKVMEAFQLLLGRDLRETLEDALYDTEILKRRFRHCATRALMILKNYKGTRKSVGRQQMKALILQNAVEELDSERNFPVLKEAYREILEDAMDIAGAEMVLREIREGKISLEGRISLTPSPFALGIILHGRSDLIKAEDRQLFLQKFYRQLLSTG